MPKIILTWLLRLVLVFVVIASGLFLWAYLSTDTSLVARGILWGDSDAGDLYRFPARMVEAGDDPVIFEPPVADILSQLTVTAEALQEGEIPFAIFLEKTNTTAKVQGIYDRRAVEKEMDSPSLFQRTVIQQWNEMKTCCPRLQTVYHEPTPPAAAQLR